MKVYVQCVIASVICLVFLTGCSNTMQGFGKDMESSGQEIQKAVGR